MIWRSCLVAALVLGLALAIFATLTVPAHASSCGPGPALIAALEGPKYRERRVATAITAGGGAALAIYANTETGDMTIVLIYPSGVACLLAAGQDFEFLPAPPEGDPT